MKYSLHTVDLLDINRFVYKENRISYKAANTAEGKLSSWTTERLVGSVSPNLTSRYQKNTAVF